MTGSLWITVHGVPIAQGSKRHVGGGRMIETSRHLRPWREAVKYAAVDAMCRNGWATIQGPVAVAATFSFPHPKSHYRTGRFAHLLKDTAPIYVATKPDADKLARSIGDALTDAGVWRDDSQIVHLNVEKRYADTAGAVIEVRAIGR